MFIKIIVCIFAMHSCFSKGASIIPLDSSVVNVKSDNSGKDYSYSIHENRAVAIETEIVQPTIVQPAIIQHEIVPAKALNINPQVEQEPNQKQEGGKQLELTSSLQKASSTLYYLPGGYPVGYPHGYTYFYRFIPVPVL